MGGAMTACNFEYLLQLVNRQLDLDRQLEVYDHLDRCHICRETVYQIARDLPRMRTHGTAVPNPVGRRR